MAEIIPYKNREDTIKRIHTLRKQLILVGGCFDILHPGHGHFLEKAKALGGSLFVILESDEAIRKKKGDLRPFQTQSDRAYMLSLLSVVDYILPIPFFKADEEYYTLVKLIKPDIIAITRGDPITNILEDQARSVGAHLIPVIDREQHYATSNIAKKLA